LPFTPQSNPLALLLQQRSGAAPENPSAAPGPAGPAGAPASNPLAPNPQALMMAAQQAALARKMSQNNLANPQMVSDAFRKIKSAAAQMIGMTSEQHPGIAKHWIKIFQAAEAGVKELDDKSGPPQGQGAGPLSFSGAALQGAPYAAPGSRFAA
jgi:hypothetical protein